MSAESFPLTMPLIFLVSILHGYEVLFALSKPYPLHLYEMLIYPIILVVVRPILNDVLLRAIISKI